MTRLTTTRRRFLAGSAALGTAASVGLPRWAMAQERTLQLRFDGGNDVLDPGYMVGGNEVETQKQCLPFLTEYVIGEDGTLSWRPTYYVKSFVQRDDTHLDFELEDWLEWSGGYGPVTAEDVKFSFERMKESDWSGYYDAMDRVDVTGERTGTIVLNQPFAPFIIVTLCHGTGAILPKKATEEAGGRFTTEFPAIAGPYLYDQIPGQRAVFTANPDWKGPRPDFDRVVCNIITEVKAAELAFEAGELDCTEIGADTLARYQSALPPGSALTVAGELQYMWLGMNTEHPNLSNKMVRRAIQHAVDVDGIIAGAYSGTTAKSNGIVCPGLVGHRNYTKYYEYNPDKARSLLQEAGVSGLTLTLQTLNNQERMLTAQIVQANLAAVGINVDIIPLDSGPFWDAGQESKGDAWKDIQLHIMRFSSQPDPYEAAQWFVSDQVGIWNWERWTDPEYDRLYKAGIAESDPAERARIYLQMQDIMEETGAYVWINHEPEPYAHRASIRISSAPSGELDYRRFEEI
jgi:peptide/nickel transport system substrate-binding protein